VIAAPYPFGVDQPELDGEPEEAGHAQPGVFSGDLRGERAEALEEVGEDGVGVHGDVSEDIVEDVGLGGVFELVGAAEAGDGGKAA